MKVHFESDTLSAVGRAWHDVALGTIVGSNLFAQTGWHPALAKVSDEKERGRVTNAAWRRYGAINAFALAGIVAGWGGARAYETRPGMLTERERRLALAKDGLTGVIAVSGAAAGLLGMRFNGMAPDGAVPHRDGNHVSGHATRQQAGAKSALKALSWIQLGSAATLGLVQAGMAQVNYRRPPLKRVFRRTY